MASRRFQTSWWCWWFFSGIVLATVPGVLCDDYNIGGLVAAAGVAFILLFVVIGMVVMGLTWNNWYPQMQWAKGKVKMPKAYWRKREEAKMRLLNGSRSGLASLAAPSESGFLPNGNTASRVRDTGQCEQIQAPTYQWSVASWVQGWNNANPVEDAGYEEMALAMDLGEERDDVEEVRIETTIVDDEHLDLGPYRHAAGGDPATPSTQANGFVAAAAAVSEKSATLEMTEEDQPQPGGSGGAGDSYVYSTVDRASKKSKSGGSGGVISDEVASGGYAGKEGEEGEGPRATSEKVTAFSKMDPYLVAL
ncbi:uncharacterized protein LOC143292367 isoform X2 [Babylonia areolata]|uniref:uncharacterized protein LOC143292367 isoform X2 n=1 Tax=Babylonia areolata TaxID=304850 RepID=UPI003FD21260